MWHDAALTGVAAICFECSSQRALEAAISLALAARA
jgi:hypothetical protein